MMPRPFNFNRTRCRTGLFLITLTLALAAPALAQRKLPPLANARLERNLRGEEAVQALGSRLNAVADFHRLPADEVRRLFQRDRSLWVDREGRLFYVCHFEPPPQNGPVGESTNSPPLSPLYPVAQTFRLHSRPGASRVVFLDFDGHDASTTIWADGSGNIPIARPFDMDGSPFTFSTAERQRIQFIWARVAEDYLQYDIDVTTEDPGVEALKNSGTGRYGVRVGIGGESTDWYNPGIGGVAYLNSFDDAEDRPCWVFSKTLSDSEKDIAEACSHEVGHTLGLTHDGQTTGVEYFEGQGNWAPIMGIGYNRAIVQWSKGEYSQANNPEDDLARMLNSGAINRPDDYGDSLATALPLMGVKPFVWGVISSRTDVDYFSFEAGAGRTTILASPSARGPNLRLQLSLYDSASNLIASATVADNNTSGVQPVTITTNLSAGRYCVSVDGIGNGSPLTTGYSDYASLGQYTLAFTLPGAGTWTAVDGSLASWTNAANWSAGTFPMGWSGLAFITNNIAGDQTIVIDTPVILGGLLLGDEDASHAFTLAASDQGGLRFGATNGNAWIGKFTGLTDSITLPLQLQTNLVITNTTASDLILAGKLEGPFTLSKQGPGRLVLAGTNNASAGLVVASGVVQLAETASLDSVSAITVQADAVLDVAAQAHWQLMSGQRLAGSGMITGEVATASSSRLSPGAADSPGTLRFANQLTLNDGTKLDLSLSSTTNSGGGPNDLITVAGDLVLQGTITVNFDFAGAQPETNGTYTLLTYGGALTGGATNFVAANAGDRFTYVFDDATTGEIRLHVSGAPAALLWQGNSMGNLWDVGGAANWLREGAPDEFYQGDAVLFDATGSTSPAINLSGVLSPASLTVSNTTSYTFGGGGRLSGATSLTKQGSGSLTLNTSNDFGGAAIIQDGTLVIGHAAALGLTNAGTTISTRGQLDLNGVALGSERLTLAGSGPDGSGALVNTGNSQTNAMRNVTLAGDTTVGGTARWDLRGLPAANVPAGLIGNGFALTKTGPNEVWLANLGNFLLGTITIAQGTLGFEGSNVMAFNGTSLIVNAGARLALRNAFDTDLSRALVLNSCIVQNDSGHNNLTGTANLSGTITTAVGEAATLDLRGTALGTGGFNKTGAGILRLAGANTFAGNLTVSEGTVIAGNNGALGSIVGTTTIATGARLDLATFSLGAEPIFVAGDGINGRGALINSWPGAQQNALRFVTLTGNTTFGGNGRWDLRANPTGSLLGAFNLSKTGENEIWLVNLDRTELKAITISSGTLGFQGTTTLGDAASTLTINSAGTLGLSTTGTNVLTKVFSLIGGRILNGSGSNTVTGNMSLSGANDFETTSGTTLVLGGPLTGSGTFNKISAGTLVLAGNNSASSLSTVSDGTLQIGAGGTAGSFAGALNNSAALVFNRASDLTHSGQISGAGTLTKQNTNTLTLSGPNTYSSVMTVGAGTLRVGNAAALGAATGGTIVASGATLDVNGFNLGAEVILASGTGVDGAGAVVNSGATQVNALRFLTLTSHTTLGGRARWDLRGVAGAGALSSGGQAFTLTKTGTNTIALNNVSVDAALGNVIVQQGVLSVEQGTTGLGQPAASVTVAGGAALNLHSLTAALNKAVVLQAGGKLSHSGPVSGGLSSTVNGTVTLSGGEAFVENTSPFDALQLNQPVSGNGQFNQTGPGLVQLNAANDYSGSTMLMAGTLKLGAAAALTATPAIAIASGAVLDVTALGGGFVLGASQTVSGNGTVLGHLIANGTVSPGGSVGRLTIAGDAALAGTALMELAKSGATLTNDVLNVSGTLVCGGTLAVARTGDPLVADDSFRLFNAGALTGDFANLSLPTLNPGLAWDRSTLTIDGWLRVVSNAAPVIGSISVSDGNLVISGSGGTPGATYHVLTAGGVAQPLAKWLPVATNTFDASGNFAFTHALVLANAQQFFRLRVP